MSVGYPEPDAAGFVLAGGRSSRMGADKALALLAGRPLVVHALEILERAGLPTRIAGARSTLDQFAPVVRDDEPDRGPLGGICAAMASISVPWAVFLPVDLPLLPSSLVTYLLHHAKVTRSLVTLLSVNGFAQSFPVVLARGVRAHLKSELESGRAGCFSAFQAAAAAHGQQAAILPVESLIQCGQVAHPKHLPVVRWFANINAPADLRRAEQFARPALRVS